jgi:hypothetical protein
LRERACFKNSGEISQEIETKAWLKTLALRYNATAAGRSKLGRFFALWCAFEMSLLLAETGRADNNGRWEQVLRRSCCREARVVKLLFKVLQRFFHHDRPTSVLFGSSAVAVPF